MTSPGSIVGHEVTQEPESCSAYFSVVGVVGPGCFV